METFILAFLAFALAVGAMAVGVMLAGKRIRGSCGGLSAFRGLDGRPVCDACADCPDRKPDCELDAAERGRPRAAASAGSER